MLLSWITGAKSSPLCPPHHFLPTDHRILDNPELEEASGNYHLTWCWKQVLQTGYPRPLQAWSQTTSRAGNSTTSNICFSLTFFFLYLDSAPPGEAQPLPSSPVTVWPCEDLCVPQRERTSPAALCRALQPSKHSPFRQDSRAALYCPAKTYLHFTAMFLVPSLDPRGMDKDHNDTVVQYPVQVLLNPCSLYSGWG